MPKSGLNEQHAAECSPTDDDSILFRFILWIVWRVSAVIDTKFGKIHFRISHEPRSCNWGQAPGAIEVVFVLTIKTRINIIASH
mmetsp:Transcript_1013/g.1601  ORF Transcript_1013/g.1601 Transcript_1013/m.1601 type:complete len:84 (-) Transcript_1013:89-340(-)